MMQAALRAKEGSTQRGTLDFNRPEKQNTGMKLCSARCTNTRFEKSRSKESIRLMLHMVILVSDA